jgi:hypothetical protein
MILTTSPLHWTGYIIGTLVLAVALLFTGTLNHIPGFTEHAVALVNGLPAGGRNFIIQMTGVAGMLQKFRGDWLLVIAGGFLLVRFYMERKHTRLVLTPEAIRVETGVFSTEQRDYKFNLISELRVKQSPAGALIGRGGIVIILSGGGELYLGGFTRPAAFKKAFYKAWDQWYANKKK